MVNPVEVGNLLAKRAENMKMGQRQLEKGKKDDEEALVKGRFPHWWRSGITGRKRARVEEEEKVPEPVKEQAVGLIRNIGKDEEYQAPRRKRPRK